MSKVWDKPITADTDWGGDASTDNLPVSGRQVQAWIKGNIKNDDAISLLIAKWLNEHTTNSITFWKGLPIDSGTLKWVDEHLTVIGGTGSSETPQDLPFIYDPVKKAWEFKGDFVVTGAITMFGSLSGFQPSTVTEAVEVDGETIVKTKNSHGQWQLTAIGGGSGSGGGISAAEVNILISNALEPYALSTSIPTDNKQLSNGAGYATVSDLDTRINNLINGAPAAYDTLKEIADVLAGNVNSIGDILTALDTKATKTYLDTELTKYVKLATAQPIEAQHNFVNGLQIGGLPITKSASANNTIYLDANLVVSGAITMFGSGSTTFPTIWANIPFDLNTMEWTGSVWRVKDDDTGSVDDATVRVIVNEVLGEKGYATEKWVTDKDYATVSVVSSAISSALVGYATQSWVGDNYLAKSGGTITTDSIAGFSIYRNNGEYSAVHFYNTQDGNKIDVGYLGAAADGRPVYINAGGGVMDLIHSGNIGSYNAGSATKLQTPRTIWGQSFDGTADVNGVMTKVNTIHFGSNEYGGKGIYRGDWYGENLSANDVVFNFSTSYFSGNVKIIGELMMGGHDVLFTSDDGSTYLNYGGSNNGRALRLCGQELIFQYGNGSAFTSAMTIKNDGNVAVGRTTADAKLHVGGSIRADYDVVSIGTNRSAGGFNLSDTGETYCGLMPNRFITTAGQVTDIWLYNNTKITYYASAHEIINDVTLTGNLLTTGVITMFSQASMKNVIDYDGLSLAQLAQIRPTRFTWEDGRDSLIHAGGIADEVMRVLPEVVHRTKDDKLTMDYGSAGFFIAASLIKPVIDHEQRLQSAEKEIKDLKAENKLLREQLRAS